MDVSIEGEIVHTTNEHPFLVVIDDELQWIEAKHLTIGDRVLAADGSTGTVEAVQVVDEPQLMYNLTIALAHTFVVGEQGWVVHNVLDLSNISQQLIKIFTNPQRSITSGNCWRCAEDVGQLLIK